MNGNKASVGSTGAFGPVITAFTGHAWRGVLVTLVGASLLGAPISWVDDGLTPSFVVYPIVLLIGIWRLSRGGRNGTLYFGVAPGRCRIRRSPRENRRRRPTFGCVDHARMAVHAARKTAICA